MTKNSNMKLFFIVLILVFTTKILKSQNSNLGLRLEFYTYGLEKVRNLDEFSSKYEISSLPGFYIFYTHKIYEDFLISFKPGIMFPNENFRGYDIGIYLRYKMPAKSIYVFIGFSKIFIGGLNNSERLNNSVSFLSIGLGHKISKHFNIDLGYFHPFDKKIGTSYDNFNSIQYPINLYNIIKLSFEFIM